MKLRNFALTLSTAALLPTFAYAGSNMDAVSASFDRDINRGFSVGYMPASVTKAELMEAINIGSHSGRDQVLASFVRDLYREPVIYKTLPAGRDADPLDAINAALRCGNSITINAGITGDLGYC
jgi:hypothetical protein